MNWEVIVAIGQIVAVAIIPVVVWFLGIKHQDETISDFTGDIQLVWDIVVPLITLALGYAFGKSRD